MFIKIVDMPWTISIFICYLFNYILVLLYSYILIFLFFGCCHSSSFFFSATNSFFKITQCFFAIVCMTVFFLILLCSLLIPLPYCFPVTLTVENITLSSCYFHDLFTPLLSITIPGFYLLFILFKHLIFSCFNCYSLTCLATLLFYFLFCFYTTSATNNQVCEKHSLPDITFASLIELKAFFFTNM